MHRRLSFQVTCHVPRGAGGEAPSSNVAPTEPMETFFKEKAPTLLLQDLWKHFLKKTQENERIEENCITAFNTLNLRLFASIKTFYFEG